MLGVRHAPSTDLDYRLRGQPVSCALAILLVATRSDRAHVRLQGGTDFVLRNRRAIASWFALAFGLLIFGDAVLSAVLVG